MKTQSAARYKKVILAIDLKAKDQKVSTALLSAIKKVAPGAMIEPVAILNREDAALGRQLQNQIGKLRDAAERHLQEVLDAQKLKDLLPAKVVFADGSYVSRAVKALLGHAQQSGADLIAVNSHNKKGLKRLVMGSFAETLTLESRVPILVVNPAFKGFTERKEVILFPTDFSSESRMGLEQVCAQVANRKVKMVLLHAFVDPSNIYMSPYVMSPLPPKYFDDEYKKLVQRGEGWAKELRARGFDCEVVVDRKAPFVGDSIFANAKKFKVSMVAMVTRTNRIGAVLLGSTTRQVLRDSLRPIWVVAPSRKNATPLVRVNRHDKREAPTKLSASARS